MYWPHKLCDSMLQVYIYHFCHWMHFQAYLLISRLLVMILKLRTWGQSKMLLYSIKTFFSKCFFFPELHETHVCICGVGIAQWLEQRTCDRMVMGSNPCWSGGRIFFSRVSFLCWLLFWYPFYLRVTAVARKRPRSFCQKCGWQVTAKHAYTLRMWLCMKWHVVWCA